MENIIVKNIYDDVNTAANNINSYFNNIDYYDTNIYTIIEKLPKYNVLIYIFIIFIIFNFINRLNIKLNEILAFMICLLLIYYLIKKDYTSFIKYTQNKNLQLKFIHNLVFNNKDWSYVNYNNLFIRPFQSSEKSYLYLDPNIIEIFFNFKNISSFNISAYVNSAIHANNILGIEYEIKIGLNRDYLNYNTAVEESKKALNELNSAIYKLPEGYIDKYKRSIELLHGILNQHLINIGNICKNNNKLNDITITTMPDNFYDENFIISADDTKTSDYISVYNMY